MKDSKKKWFHRGLAFICAAAMFLCPGSAVSMSAHAAEATERTITESTRKESTEQISEEAVTASTAEEMKAGLQGDGLEEESATAQSAGESKNLQETTGLNQEKENSQTVEENGQTQESTNENTAEESEQVPQAGPSIRRIISPVTTPRRTYEFYVDDTLVDSQTVKNNEYLTEPSKPEKSGNVFKGWSVDGGETLLSFGEDHPITDITGENGTEETVQVYPVFEQKYTITFHNKDGSVITIRTGKPEDTISISDVKFEVLNGYYVSGWTKDPEGSETGKVGDSITIPAAGDTSSDYNDGNMDLYPIMKDVCWIFFDDGMGNDSTERSYTVPSYIKQGEKVTKPSDPVREGYQFKGWSTKQDGTENDLYDFDTPVTQSMVLYAVWEPVETTYTVEVMIEELVDGKYVEGNYSPAGEYVPTSQEEGTNKITAVTGTTINPTEGKEGTSLDQDDIVKWFDEKSGVQNSYAYDFDKMDQDVTVKGDGQTIVHAYFKLHVFTVNFNLINHRYRNGGLLTYENPYIWRIPGYPLGYYANYVSSVADVSFTINGKTYTIADESTACYSIHARLGEDISRVYPAPQKIDAKIVIKDGVEEDEDIQTLKAMTPFAWYMYYNNKAGATYYRSRMVNRLGTDNIRKSYTRENQVDYTLYFLFQTAAIHKVANTMLENIDDDSFTLSSTSESNNAAVGMDPSNIRGFTWVFDTRRKETYNAPEGTSEQYPDGYPKTTETDDTKIYYFYYYRNRYTLQYWNRGGGSKGIQFE